MTTIKVDTIVGSAGGIVNVLKSMNINGTALSSSNTMGITIGTTEPSGTNSVGSYWFNTSNDKLHIYVGDGTGNGWKVINQNALPPPWAGFSGVFVGGNSGGFSDTIQTINIPAGSNAVDFGNLLADNKGIGIGAAQGGGRVVTAGGNTNGGSPKNRIGYVTVATPGNSTSFGLLTVARDHIAGSSSGTRAVWNGGTTNYSAGLLNRIDYNTIATTGNATDFGDVQNLAYYRGYLNSTTRQVVGGGGTAGSNTAATNVMDYITIATTGNSTNFGSFVMGVRRQLAGVSDNVRGLFVGGRNANSNNLNTMEYITIATTGNAINAAQLTAAAAQTCGCSDGVTGVIASASANAGTSNGTQKINIATSGASTVFATLLAGVYDLAATSG